ncbi:MAG: bifunctional [glutamate--ammonia ligase]-adenylyl-L-tyrosine phosphorylase/[glutamate--ammonia-ligase] adenylyltransferase [Polyangiales bacterium]
MASSDTPTRRPHAASSSHRVTSTPAGESAIAVYTSAGGDLSEPAIREAVSALGEHAPAYLPLCTADLDLLADVLARPLGLADDEDGMRERFLAATAELEDGPELRKALRRLRHRCMVRIVLREVFRLADVDQTSAEMAALAAGATDAALAACRRTVERRHGAILDPDGQPVPFVVLGMGKLGGRELNLGSDIDLIYFYGTDEGQVGNGDISIHDAFTRLGTRLTNALGDVTEDGFCFRVDLRLRPEGSQGPVANSLASAERYYESFGRTWERAAMLRARPIAGDLAFGYELLSVLRPFIYRRTVDPRIAIEMTEMVNRARRELKSDPERDVKLCRGGIREAEFYLQTLQLLWGGVHPQLQTPSTTQALRKLRAQGLVGHQEAMTLGADWALLRSVEHRIHMRVSHQTHDLPPLGPERDRFARSLGFDDGAAFDTAFRAAKHRVARLFDTLLEGQAPEGADPKLDRLIDLVTTGASNDAIAEAVAEALPVQDPMESAAHLRRLARHAYSPLGPAGLERAPGLAKLLLSEVRNAAHPDTAIRCLADFFAKVKGEWSYDRMILEQPMIARRLVGFFGASATLSAAMIGHPESMDEIVALRGAMPTVQEIRDAHGERPFRFEALPDPEDYVSAMRRLKRELTLRIGLAYVSGDVDLGETQERLTALADCQIDAAFRFATEETRLRFGSPTTDEAMPATMVVVGMGKLGSREMGFGSDLDLVFYYGADGVTDGGPRGRVVDNTEAFARVGQRTLALLSQLEAEGPGYETDTRLRPNGTRGPLVQSIAAFDRYFETSGAAWERQALIRARVVAGDPTLARLLEERMEATAYSHGAVPGPELAEMRKRMEVELSNEKSDRFHAKTGFGGLVDVEFLAQWLCQKHGDDRRVHKGNTIEALRALRAAGYLSRNDSDVLEEAFRFFREVEQSVKLVDEHREAAIVPGGPMADRVARRLRMRQRDGVEPGEVLVDTWIRRATDVRRIFERIVAPVGLVAPWPTEET